MSGENAQDSFSNDRAELFEALGHPTRIKILELLANSPMGFSDLKKALDIDSGGQLQFHLGKLHGLVKTVEGSYTLTDEGKEALRMMAAKEPVKTEAKTLHSFTPLQVITIVLAIALAFTVAFSLYNNQLQNQNFNNLNQSYVVLDQFYNEHNLQFNNLLNQFYSGGIVANLSTSDEFRSVAKEMGAKYFSINPDTGYNDRGTIINGYIWDENGTFILTYSASVDFITFKVSNVGVFEPVCIGCGENMTLIIPQMSDYVVYTIQGIQ
jgi:DNA-binding transcriptional ArsR family regulator